MFTRRDFLIETGMSTLLLGVLGCGKQDSLFAANEKLDATLTAANIRHTFLAVDGKHDYLFWRRCFEETATQLFRPLRNNDLILGAVGPLQFDVVAFRLADEYGVTCAFEPVNVVTARWVRGGDAAKLAQFRERAYENLALDHAGELVYLAPTRINLSLTVERWPELAFRETREHLAAAA